jgi:putative ABC transport system ATP-binding protein
MLKASHLVKYFNKGTPNKVLAVDDCTIEITDSEFVLIVGSNGSGKSTLLNLIAGSYFPDSGRIEIDGTDVTAKKDFSRSKWIARVFQDPMAGTAADLSIIDNFRLAALRTKRKSFRTGVDKKFREAVREKIAVLNLGMENKLETMVGRLSGGQRQALTLMMAVMDDSKILLLDEPTAALDPRSADTVIRIADKVISDLKLTAMLVTHNMSYALHYGSRLVMMKNGKIEKDLSQEEKKNLKLVDLYEWFNTPVLP